METCGSVSESVPSETELDVSYVQGKWRICKAIHEKIKAAHESLYSPQLVGLYGGGGTGTTTFCKAMCNEMQTEFNGRVCHIELRGESELTTIQTMLTKLTGARHEDAQRLNRYECDRKLGKNLKQKVFIAIDNVTDSAKVIAQAQALLQRGYAQGSVALVTARTSDQLEKVKLQYYGGTIYESDCLEMSELEEHEARALLLHHASPSNHVNEDTFIQCLQRCYFSNDDGDSQFLPLALEVLGLQLGDDADQWKGRLEELETLKHPQEREHPVFSLLRKRFDVLDKEDQMLFVDAALFCRQSRGWNVSTFDWLHMVHGGSAEDIKMRLKGLKEKSFLQSIDERTTEIAVHDLWREFAVIEASVGKKDSSLWFYHNDADDQTDRHRGDSTFPSGGWENLQRAYFLWKKSKFQEELNFTLCSNLTVLTLRNIALVNKELDLTPLKCLKYLELNLHGAPGSGQVLGLGSLKRLLVLRWFRMLATSPCLQEIGLLTNLQVLQLEFLPLKQKDFTRTKFHQMDFSRLILLRKFSIIATGDNWMRYFESYGDVNILMQQVKSWRDYGAESWRFQMQNVHMLESLQNFHKLQGLQELDISRCAFIQALPGLEELVALLELKASGCTSLKKLPSLHKLQRLQRLDISFCCLLTAVPWLDELVSLLELDARACYNLEALPILQKLQKLQRLDISVCSTIKLVPGLGELVALVALHAAGCTSLEELPSLGKLSKLQMLDISWCPLLKALPGLGALVALQELCAKDCFALSELPDMRKLTSLRVLNLKISHYYEELRVKEEADQMYYYSDYRSTSLKAVPGLGELTALSTLTVDFQVFEVVPDLHKLVSLKKLMLRGWSSAAAAGVASLPSLELLKISYCEGLQLVEPTGITSLRALRRLHLYRCDFEDLSCLTRIASLQRLHVKYHANLKRFLRSMLELPSGLTFTVSVDTGDNRISMEVQDEVDSLQARGVIANWWE